MDNGKTARPHHQEQAARQLRDLAEACARGDRAAFDHLHRRFSPGILAFFAKRGALGAAEADDLAQHVWIGVWAALEKGRYDPARASISTFIYAVASKTWLQHLRARGGAAKGSENAPLDEALEELADEGDDALGLISAAEQIDAVRAFLKERGRDEALTDQEHHILVNSAGGASDRDLAARLALAPSTVNAKKQSGLGKVRRFLARLGHKPEQAERADAASE